MDSFGLGIASRRDSGRGICFLWGVLAIQAKSSDRGTRRRRARPKSDTPVFTPPIFRVLVVFSKTWFSSTIRPRPSSLDDNR